MTILGQVRLSKGLLCPAGLEKGIGKGPAELEPWQGLENGKNTPSNNFKNPRSSIKPGSAPDPS